MFAALARFAHRFRWPILVAFLVVLPVAGLIGGGVFRALKPGGFDDPGSESFRARAQLLQQVGAGRADAIVLYTTTSGTVTDPSARAAVTEALARIAQDPSVVSVTSYYSTGAPQFISVDRRRTFAVITLRGDDQEQIDAVQRLRPQLEANGLTVQLGGNVPVFDAVSKTVEHDLRRAEVIAFPITAVLLVVIFGSLVSAGLPLLIGGAGILLAFTTLRTVAALTDVSVFALNIVTVMGLGLAIDYSLFIVNRYREELARPGREPREALVTAISTTGRAVAFSGVTVAASLIGLFAFPQTFLRSMALGGIAVTLMTIILALTLLPALIAVLGRRVDALRLPWAARPQPGDATRGFWHRIATTVMRRPLLVAAVVVALLLGLGAPFLRFNASATDQRVLSPSVEARQVSDILDAEFLPHQTTPHEIAVTTRGDALSPADIGALYDYVQRVAALPGVTRVDSIFSLAPGLSRAQYQELYGRPADQLDPALAAGLAAYARGHNTRLSVVSAGDPDAPGTQAQVQELRSLPPPDGMTVLVGGAAAGLTDLKHVIRQRVPLMIGVIASVMFVVLFLVFGSVTLPLKAMAMNLLSLTASYGALVWIFQDGRFEGLLHYTSTGGVDTTNPILMFAILFGLSMDYEVLLLARVREEYTRTGDNTLAVAHGLEKTGRLITSAAALLVIVIGAFATSSIVFMKELGVGMALAIALDATIVRALLVPAAMRLMGRWNWWAPAPLTRLWQRVGVGDLERPVPAAAAGD